MHNPKVFAAPQVDLTNCDREPIHIPGRIQSYGLLFVVDSADLRIVQVSGNSENLIQRSPESLLGSCLDTLIQPAQIAALRSHFVDETTKYTHPIPVTLEVGGQQQRFNGVMHRNPQGVFILELEPVRADEAQPMHFYDLVRMASASLQNTRTLADLCQVMVREVKRITHFDRVMVYQFEEDGHGRVIAEALEADMEPYLGLHYPASDIPQQARQLYLRNWLRLIADVEYQPVDIMPTLHPQTGLPIDLTYAFLRSVSPVHIEYLKNMGVAASMSISLIQDGQLWGLIACHHRSTLYVPYEVRTVCEFLGQLFSIQLGTRQEGEDLEYQVRVQNAAMRCIERVTLEEAVVTGLMKAGNDLLLMTGAHGVAIVQDDNVRLVGHTPDEAQVRTLIDWLDAQPVNDVFATHHLASHLPPAADYAATASGLLAISIASMSGAYVLWFRAEVIQTVTWSGNPDKPVEISADGEQRLSPRKSFAAWRQTVRQTASPWTASEVQAAQALRDAIIDVALRNIEKLARVNAELERSNNELDSFAYIASHDLKEPLRGIHNFATFLMEDYQAVLDEEGVSKLRTLVRLTQRMEDLINSLLHFSRVGRIEMAYTETSLNQVLSQTLELLHARIQTAQVEVRVPRPLPTVVCDQVRVGEVFNNLISNAIKYNTSAQKWIEIGYLDETPPVFYVRDNGIGIQEKHYETIFRIFKRLHTRDEYGGGTGSGLTITRKIIERHGGTIWLDSIYGQGTTFYFTLEGQARS